ncbi:MAG: dephospho-CoA kinase [Chloroflexi bacterium]|nr:dephospho-CoA kinase [Chloroflexota bacterium]
MLVIGLTGGIGTGKSTVSQMLQELGAVVIDADRVGHEAYRPGTPAWRDIVAEWGKDVLLPSGEVDRKKLGSIVFNNPQALQRLNDIVHPRMRAMMDEMLGQYRKEGRGVAVLDAAILLEAKWSPLVDQVWVTVAPEETVIRRIQGRNGLPAEQIRARVRSQLSTEERVARADVVIDTDCTIPEVREKVRKLWEERMAKRKDPAADVQRG